MKTFFNLISEPVISSFGWMLVHSLWQGTLLAVLVAISFSVFRTKAASLRYTIGIFALITQTTSSLVTFFYYYSRSGSQLSVNNTAIIAQKIPDWKTLTYEVSITEKVQLWLSSHIQELVICWLIGAFVLALRFIGGWLYTEYLRYNASLVMNKEWRARFGILTAKLKIYQNIELKESAKILSPIVIGTLQPVVLIPIGFLTGFPTSQIEAILSHELAHIRRHDYLVNMIQSIIEVVFFFHPALWWISEKIRVERENCCDDLAVEACGDRISLAHALVGIAEWKSNHSLAMAFASKKPLLLQRVKRVLGVAPKPTRFFASLPVTVLFVASLVSLSLYAVGQDDVKKKKAKTHQISTRHKTASGKSEPVVNNGASEIFVAIPDIDNNIDISFDEPDEFEQPMNDSLKAKMNEFQQKMEVLQKEMEPLQARMMELQQEMEKQHFEIEHFERNEEKLDWKKDRANEARQNLIEKRSDLLHSDGKPKTKLNEADLEKQLADFEQQIKVQEQVINQLNSELANNHKDAEKAEEPYKKIEKEMDELGKKIDEIGLKMGLASLSFPKHYTAASRSSKAHRAVPSRKAMRALPPPPPPLAPKAVRAPMPKAPPAPPVKR